MKAIMATALVLAGGAASAGIEEKVWQVEVLDQATRLSVYADLTYGNRLSIYVPKGSCAGHLDFWFASYNTDVLPPYEGEKIPVSFSGIQAGGIDEFADQLRLAAVIEDPFGFGTPSTMHIAVLTVGEITHVWEFASIIEDRGWTHFEAKAPDDVLFDIPLEQWTTRGLPNALREVPGCQKPRPSDPDATA